MRGYFNSLLNVGNNWGNAALIQVFFATPRLLFPLDVEVVRALTRQMFVQVIDFP